MHRDQELNVQSICPYLVTFDSDYKFKHTIGDPELSLLLMRFELETF